MFAWRTAEVPVSPDARTDAMSGGEAILTVWSGPTVVPSALVATTLKWNARPLGRLVTGVPTVVVPEPLPALAGSVSRP